MRARLKYLKISFCLIFGRSGADFGTSGALPGVPEPFKNRSKIAQGGGLGRILGAKGFLRVILNRTLHVFLDIICRCLVDVWLEAVIGFRSNVQSDWINAMIFDA